MKIDERELAIVLMGVVIGFSFVLIPIIMNFYEIIEDLITILI